MKKLFTLLLLMALILLPGCTLKKDPELEQAKELMAGIKASQQIYAGAQRDTIAGIAKGISASGEVTFDIQEGEEVTKIICKFK